MQLDTKQAQQGPGRTGDAYFREYVRFSPIAHAISRAIEARHLGTVEQKAPMLDIGCGFGEFGRPFFRIPVDAGVDIRRFDLTRRLPGVYRSVVWCDARKMPLASDSFETIFSVSVLEHIPDVQRVLEEAARVLRPGGTFALTVPTEAVSRMWAVPRMLSAVGLSRIGRAYADRLNKTWDHFNLWTGDEWASRIKSCGLLVETCKPIMSARATATFDLMLPTALPSQIGRLVTKKRFVHRPPGMVEMLTSRFARLVNEEEREGSNLFIVARKP
ncbi:MAG TPA: class I SAM-dependent methyltransferase [Dehalococcoidia bacterium]